MRMEKATTFGQDTSYARAAPSRWMGWTSRRALLNYPNSPLIKMWTKRPFSAKTAPLLSTHQPAIKGGEHDEKRSPPFAFKLSLEHLSPGICDCACGESC